MRIRALPVGLAAAALLTLTACNDDGSTNTTPSAKPAPASSAPASSPSVASSAPAAGSVPSPNAAQTAGLLAALKAVDPSLATDQAKAITRARNVCQEIKAGKDDATLANNAAQRFSGGVTLTPEQGAVIVAGVKAAFCS